MIQIHCCLWATIPNKAGELSLLYRVNAINNLKKKIHQLQSLKCSQLSSHHGWTSNAVAPRLLVDIRGYNTNVPNPLALPSNPIYKHPAQTPHKNMCSSDEGWDFLAQNQRFCRILEDFSTFFFFKEWITKAPYCSRITLQNQIQSHTWEGSGRDGKAQMWSCHAAFISSPSRWQALASTASPSHEISW